ncbi:PAS domain S-box protein [candidate division KSB1 bacterium]|nr:PAS domain S-box protein [candidate division KSB1 bacterium]
MEENLNIVFIDQDQASIQPMVTILKKSGLLKAHQLIRDAQSLETAIAQKPDLLVSRAGFAPLPPLDVLDILKKQNVQVALIVVAENGDDQQAVSCLQAGAHDYLSDAALNRLDTAVQDALHRVREKHKQKQMERALILTKYTVDHASISIYWVGLNGRFMYVNEAGLRLTGYTLSELTSMTIFDIDPSTSAQSWPQKVQDMQQQTSVFEETIFKHKDGRLITVELTCNYFKHTGRDYILIFSRDISGRKRAEAEYSRLATAIEQAGESIMITDCGGNILYVNPAFERISGYNKESVIGKRPSILKSDKQDKPFYDRLWGTIMNGKSWRGHFINRRKNGGLYKEEATISPIKDKNGKINSFVAVKRDVTDDIHREKQLYQAQKMEAIGRLAGGVAHDFNNLLTIITGYTELAIKQIDKNDPLRTNLEQIHKAIERGSNLTRQLLAFGRRQPLEAKVIDLNAVLGDMIKMLKRLLGDDIQLETSLDKTSGHIKADPGQIEQIIINLAVNARDAMPGGGKLFIATEKRNLDEKFCQTHPDLKPGTYVRISVRDNGVGMSEEIKSKIFEPFFTTKSSGMGMGLSSVFGIVRQSGGYITCMSDIEKGTEFQIFFPAVDQPVEDESGEKEVETLPRGNETILLVEDETEVRELAARMLRLQGYTVLDAAQGGEALLLCEQHEGPIHLLIADVIMPKMGGTDLAKRLKAIKPEMHVLYISGFASNIINRESGDEEKAFLPKPFTYEEITRKVRQVLDN